MPREDLVYDVGMHRGEDTAYYLAKGYDVVAFEADPDHLRHCRERFAAAIDDGRLRIVEGAITSGDAATVAFYRSGANSVWGSLDTSWVAQKRVDGKLQRIEVPTVDFADALRRYDVPTYLKVDIEGADEVCFEVLGALDERPRFVSLESELYEWDTLLRQFAMLQGLGYRAFVPTQQEGIAGTVVSTADRLGRPLSYEFEPDASGPFGNDLGGWTPAEEAIERYRRLFRRYRVSRLVRRLPHGRRVDHEISRLIHRPLAGWHDLHARLDEPWRA